MSRVYIAGPMTGRPGYNFAAFDKAAAQWRGYGHTVTTPADITRAHWLLTRGRVFDPETDRCEYGDADMCALFAQDMAAVCAADTILVLDGWLGSRGARIEAAIACALGKRFVDAVTYERLDVEAVGTVVRSVVAKEAA